MRSEECQTTDMKITHQLLPNQNARWYNLKNAPRLVTNQTARFHVGFIRCAQCRIVLMCVRAAAYRRSTATITHAHNIKILLSYERIWSRRCWSRERVRLGILDSLSLLNVVVVARSHTHARTHTIPTIIRECCVKQKVCACVCVLYTYMPYKFFSFS